MKTLTKTSVKKPLRYKASTIKTPSKQAFFILEKSISKSPQDNPQIITKQPLQVVAVATSYEKNNKSIHRTSM